ncbi:glycoside hydrolase family 18 [Pyrenophora seminiperda CCB06]|uniref:Glycoside hydrolase family 18 n=1 Tax=Pyrenophora seminiperda CCB06 TaxID=1302712 RepID=A0A3M7MA55_9PLEO|nr:glycoside hydrolase family 18 [Pyrenophora seminiperda CCB06]
MPTLHAFFNLPTVLLATLVARAYADDGAIDDGKTSHRPTYATALTGGEGCKFTDIEEIRDGFSEMTKLLAAATPFDLTSQPARELFGSSILGNYTDLIATNLQRAANYAVLVGAHGAVNADIHIRCDDPMKLCNKGNKREGDHAAYNIGNDPHVVFCPDYFDMDSLDARIDKKAQSQIEKDRLMEYYNRASLWARMVMHFGEIGTAVVQRPAPAPPNATSEWVITESRGAMNTSVLAGVLNEQPDRHNDPPTLKYAYGATRAKLLAVLSTQMPYDAANNAENYALYALAQYIIKRRGFYPAVPIMDFPNEASVLTNENLQDGERVKYAYFDATDVVARPANMALKGAPLPTSDASANVVSSAGAGLAAIAMTCCFLFSSMG